MAWAKGVSGNPSGRPRDAKASAIRESISDSLDIEKLRTSLEELEGADYVQGVAKLLPYILPRLNSVEVVQVDTLEAHLPDLSDEQLTKAVNLIVNEYDRRNGTLAGNSENNFGTELQGIY